MGTCHQECLILVTAIHMGRLQDTPMHRAVTCHRMDMGMAHLQVFGGKVVHPQALVVCLGLLDHCTRRAPQLQAFEADLRLQLRL